MAGRADPTPCTCVCQLAVEESTCVRVLMPGDTAETPLISDRMALASSGTSVVTAPWPVRTPPKFMEPALTVTMLVPRLETCDSMDARAPPPIAIITITAATPMMIPSEVSAERNRFLPMASKAVCTVLDAVVMAPSPSPLTAARRPPAREGGHQRRSTSGRLACLRGLGGRCANGHLGALGRGPLH